MPLSPIQPKPDATPPDTNDEKATIHNFLANKSCVNWTLFAVVLIFTGAAIYFYIQAQNISHEHLNKTQQLLQEIQEGRDATNETIKEIDSLRNTFSIYGLRLILSLIILVSCFSKPIMKLLNEYPQRVFVSTIALGGILAFSIPQYLYSFKYIGETKDITTSLLTVTGGILAVFTLLKTHQKNETDEKKFEYEKIVHDEQKKDREEDIRIQKRQFNKTIKQESYKFYKERIRQVHAERRSRYTKAIEQLADEKGPIRLGGVHSLVGLIDEWLNDNDITDETRMKEGQVIINNLCSYIRSPFPLAAQAKEFEGNILGGVKIPDNHNGEEFIAELAIFYEEQDIRRTIFIEMDKRSSIVTTDGEGNIMVTPGAWSKFQFNFTRAPIFYSLSNLTIEQPNFYLAQFYGNIDFRRTFFIQSANFSATTFTERAYFCGTTFIQGADFLLSNFDQKTCFCSATFTHDAIFRRVTFAHRIDFSLATFSQDADFGGATFAKNGFFRAATFTHAKPKFTYSDVHGGVWRAQFAAGVDPQNYDFTVYGSIDLGEATLLGETFEIPIDTLLFDPMSPKNKYGNYSGLSSPAKSKQDSGSSLKILTL